MIPSNAKILRINKRKNVMIGQLPLDIILSSTYSSLNLSLDESPNSQPKDISTAVKEDSRKRYTPCWRISNLLASDNTPIEKDLVSTSEDTEAETYFMLSDTGGDSMDIYPIYEFFNFQPDIYKKFNSLKSSDFAENEAKQNILKDADLTARVLSLRRNESDDENKVKKDKEKFGSQLASDDYGIKRQENKQRKNVLRAKRGYTIKPNDYVNSVLAISSLRHNPGTWDYNEDERSDDEEDVLGPNSSNVVEPFDEDDLANTNDLESDDDPLSEYGQAVKSLLKNQANQEAEEELDQYSDEDDEKQALSGDTLETLSTSNENLVRGQTKEDIEAKILRLLRKNMGKMEVKVFMSEFVSQERKEHSSLIKSIIKKRCTVRKEIVNGKTVQYILLKALWSAD